MRARLCCRPLTDVRLRWQPPIPENLTRTVKYIEENVGEDLSNPTLARHAGMSVEGFGRAFRRHYDTTPARFVTEMRVREAGRLLLQSDETIEDITEAYQTLGDPTARSRYDRLGPLYNADGRPPRPDELNEVFSSVIGNIFKRRRDPAGANDTLVYTFEVFKNGSTTVFDSASGVNQSSFSFTPNDNGEYTVFYTVDDDGRLMVIINFNVDLGDAWEMADQPWYPEEYTARAYRFGVNFVLYAMTH